MTSMHIRDRMSVLVVVMSLVAVGVGGTVMSFLYRAAFREQRARLTDTAHGRAHMMEAIARFDSAYGDNYPGGFYEATLSQVRAAHEEFEGFGNTGELAVARREGDLIVFVLRHRHAGKGMLDDTLPFFGERAEPMRRALSGRSGTVIGIDYRGERVLAAYEPVTMLDLGVVAKIDLAEVRAPFVRAGLLGAGGSLILIVLGIGIFRRVANPLLREVDANARRYRGLFENAPVSIWEEDFFQVKTYLDDLGFFEIEDVESYLDDHPDVVRQCAQRVTVLAVNRRAAELHEADNAAELLKELSRITEVSYVAFRRELVAMWRGDTECEVEGQVITLKGSLRDVIVKWSIVPGHEEDLSRILVSLLDVTDRKRSEEALREGEKRLSLTLDAVSDGAWDWNVATGEVRYSDRWVESLGYRPEEVEPHESFWRSLIHPDDVPKVDEALMEHFDGRTDYYECENRLRMKSGEYRDNLDRGKVISRDAQGRPLRMVGTDTDITERRKAENALRTSESRYRLLFQDSRDAIFITSVDGRFADVNDAGLDLLRYSRDEFADIRVADISDDLDGMRQFQHAVDKVGFVKDYLALVRRKDGVVLDCLLTSTARRAADGTVIGYQTIARDDTQRRRMENELRRSRNELYIRNRISHVFLTEAGDELFGELLDVLIGATESEFGFLGYIDEDGALVCASMRQRTWTKRQMEQKVMVVPPSSWEGIWGQSLRECRTIWSNDSLKMPEFQLQLNAAIAVPIVHGKKLIGQFVLANKPAGYDARDGEFLDTLAEYIFPLLESKLTAERTRKFSEQAWATVRGVRDRLQLSIDRMPIAYILWDESTKVTVWNPAAARIFGYTNEEAVGRSLLDLVVPDSIRLDVANVMQALLGGEEASYSEPNNNVCKDGTVISCQWYNTPIKLGDQETSLVLSMVLDVTKQVEGEKTLRLNSAALEAAANAIVITDEEGAIQWTNSAFERCTGYNQEEVAGRNPRFLKSGRQGRAFYIDLWDTILDGRTWHGEMTNKRKNGTLYTEEQSITPMSSGGEITHFISIRQDITERKRLEQEVLEIDERERQSIGQDLHDMLGQQLTGMGLMLQALRGNAARQEAVDSDVVSKLQDLVKTAAVHTRFVSRGLLKLTPGRSGLIDALEDLASTAEKLFDITCDIRITDNVEISDSTVTRHVYHIAQEAVTNAVRHGRAASVVIALRLHEDKTVMSVSDDGCGIPDNLPSDKGLGLSTMRYRAHAIGGSLEVRRGEESGTVVRCTLPRMSDPGQDQSTYLDG